MEDGTRWCYTDYMKALEGRVRLAGEAVYQTREKRNNKTFANIWMGRCKIIRFQQADASAWGITNHVREDSFTASWYKSALNVGSVLFKKKFFSRVALRTLALRELCVVLLIVVLVLALLLLVKTKPL